MPLNCRSRSDSHTHVHGYDWMLCSVWSLAAGVGCVVSCIRHTEACLPCVFCVCRLRLGWRELQQLVDRAAVVVTRTHVFTGMTGCRIVCGLGYRRWLRSQLHQTSCCLGVPAVSGWTAVANGTAAVWCQVCVWRGCLLSCLSSAMLSRFVCSWSNACIGCATVGTTVDALELL